MNLYRRLRSTVGRPVKAALRRFFPGRYHCPVCGSGTDRFIPIGEHFLEPKRRYGWPYALEDTETCNFWAYACPHCGASDRERLYALYLREKFQHQATPCRLLEIAPAEALQKFISTFGNVEHRTGDLFRTDVDIPGLDVTDMSRFAEGSFDALICSHVLEHVPDDGRAMRELFRVLKPGGWAIIMAPINLKATTIDEDPAVTDVGERWRRFGQDDHVRLYNKAGFLERLRDAGFIVRELGREHFGADVFARCGITSQSMLYVSEKPRPAA